MPLRGIVSEFIEAFRDAGGLTRTRATEVVALVLDEISNGLVSADRMDIKFGKELKDGVDHDQAQTRRKA